jgi:hypothetical protein
VLTLNEEVENNEMTSALVTESSEREFVQPSQLILDKASPDIIPSKSHRQDSKRKVPPIIEPILMTPSQKISLPSASSKHNLSEHQLEEDEPFLHLISRP